MVSVPKRYREQEPVDFSHGEKSQPSAVAAAPVAPAEPPAEPPKPETQSPVEAAASSAIKDRLAEMERAEVLARQPQQPPVPQVPQQPQQTAEQIITQTNLPDRAKDWLRRHPDYATDPVKTNRLLVLDEVATRRAGGQFTDAYFEHMEDLLGIAPATNGQPRGATEAPRNYEPPPRPRSPAPPQRSAPVAYGAPPTRESPSMSSGRPVSNSQISLTKDEVEIALACKLNENESDRAAIERYARNKKAALDKNLIGPGVRYG